jgi:hypothetical protein
MKFLKLYLFIAFVSLSVSLFGQDDEAYYDSLLLRTVENVNFSYKPVIGIGIGVMNFYGEVSNNTHNTNLGSPAFKINVATFLDKNHYFKANFTLLKGTVSGDHRSLTDTAWNLNFKSDIIAFGINVHYDFRNVIKTSPLRPFVSLGIENIQFNSKTDLKDAEGNYYNYWSDGSIHSVPESEKGSSNDKILTRDYNYETDLSSMYRYGLGNYSQSTFSLPLEIGLDYAVTNRINFRVAQSWHYTFSDLIDNVSSKNKTGIKGKAGNDMFTYSYFSFHWDLFSEDKYITVRDMFADVDNFDYTMFADEDNDMVKDFMDQCPGTPFNVKVDSTGCPLDADKDGVPDYLDKEPNSRPGVMVDDDGVEISAESLAQKTNTEAIKRSDVETFLLMHRAQSKGWHKSDKPLPPKFKSVDTDGDNYISFDELLKAIDDYFDFSSELKANDVYELQDFFFEQ